MNPFIFSENSRYSTGPRMWRGMMPPLRTRFVRGVARIHHASPPELEINQQSQPWQRHAKKLADRGAARLRRDVRGPGGGAPPCASRSDSRLEPRTRQLAVRLLHCVLEGEAAP